MLQLPLASCIWFFIFKSYKLVQNLLCMLYVTISIAKQKSQTNLLAIKWTWRKKRWCVVILGWMGMFFRRSKWDDAKIGWKTTTTTLSMVVRQYVYTKPFWMCDDKCKWHIQHNNYNFSFSILFQSLVRSNSIWWNCIIIFSWNS